MAQRVSENELFVVSSPQMSNIFEEIERQSVDCGHLQDRKLSDRPPQSYQILISIISDDKVLIYTKQSSID